MALTVHHLHIGQSERIVWLCEELGIPYTLKTYTRDPMLAPAELAALTPMKTAPVLTTTNPVTGDEFSMSESGAIAEFINTVHGGGRLSLGPDHADYAEYLFWFHFANASLSPASSLKMFAAFMGAAASPDSPGAQMALARQHKALSVLDARCAATGAYLAGADLTLADIMTMWTLGTSRMWSRTDLSPYPGVLAYMDRIARTTKYGLAMEKAEPGLDWRKGLTKEGPDLFPALKLMLQKQAEAQADSGKAKV